MKKRMAMAMGIILLSAPAFAGTVGITAKVGTLGFGGDLTLPLVASNLNFRAGYNWGNLTLDVDLDEAACDGEITWETIPILLDWYPAAGEFRISAGAVINNNEVIMSASPTEDFKLNGVHYGVTGMDGSITFDEMAWYVGVGSGNAVGDGRVHFVFDLGVMLQGKPKAEATATASIPALQNALNADLQSEVDDFQQDLNAFILYPVISVGIAFAF